MEGACYEPEDIALTREEVEEAHKLGLKIVTWRWSEHSGSPFDPLLVKQQIEWGIDGLIVDDPARLNSMLAAMGMRVPKGFTIARK